MNNDEMPLEDNRPSMVPEYPPQKAPDNLLEMEEPPKQK